MNGAVRPENPASLFTSYKAFISVNLFTGGILKCAYFVVRKSKAQSLNVERHNSYMLEIV